MRIPSRRGAARTEPGRGWLRSLARLLHAQCSKVPGGRGSPPVLLTAAVLALCLTGFKEKDSIWIDFGDKEAVYIRLSQAARQLLNQFPLVQILDEHLLLTVNVVMFKVKDETGEEFELFYRYWDGKWIKRVEQPDGSYSFEDYP